MIMSGIGANSRARIPGLVFNSAIIRRYDSKSEAIQLITGALSAYIYIYIYIVYYVRVIPVIGERFITIII